MLKEPIKDYWDTLKPQIQLNLSKLIVYSRTVGPAQKNSYLYRTHNGRPLVDLEGTLGLLHEWLIDKTLELPSRPKTDLANLDRCPVDIETSKDGKIE